MALIMLLTRVIFYKNLASPHIIYYIDQPSKIFLFISRLHFPQKYKNPAPIFLPSQPCLSTSTPGHFPSKTSPTCVGQIFFSLLGQGGISKSHMIFFYPRALTISMFHKYHTFLCLGKISCVEFQRYPLKFYTKYLTKTLKDIYFIWRQKMKSTLSFKSSFIFFKPSPQQVTSTSGDHFTKIYLSTQIDQYFSSLSYIFFIWFEGGCEYQLNHSRDHFVYAPSQWETTLQCNVVSHWLGTYTKLSLDRHSVQLCTGKRINSYQPEIWLSPWLNWTQDPSHQTSHGPVYTSDCTALKVG